MLYIIVCLRSDGKAPDVFTAANSFNAQHQVETAQAGIYGEYDRVDMLILCDNHGWAPAIDRGCSKCEAEIVAAQVAFESELPELQGVCDDCEIGDCGACSISSELPSVSDKAEMVADMLGWPGEVIDVAEEIAELACKTCEIAKGCVLVHNEDGHCYPPGEAGEIIDTDGYSGGCDTCADGTCGYCVTDEVAKRHDDDVPELSCVDCMYNDMDCHGDPMGPDAACIESELGTRKSHLDVIKERPVRPSNHWFPTGVTPAPVVRNAVDEYMAEYREHQRLAALEKDAMAFRAALDVLDKAAVERSKDPCAADEMIHGLDCLCYTCERGRDQARCDAARGREGMIKEGREQWGDEHAEDCLCIACIADLGDDAFLDAMGVDTDGFKLKDLDLAPPCPMVTNGLNVSTDGSTDFTVYCDDCGGCKCHKCECAKDVPKGFHEWSPTANDYDECIVCGATVATFFPVSDSVIQMRCDIITGECPGPHIDEGEPQMKIEQALHGLIQEAIDEMRQPFPSDDGECPVDCTCWVCTP